jgi:CubicO group peptidase (beta-lactamase class C family)
MTLAAAAEAAFALVEEAIAAGRIPGGVLGLVTREGERAICYDGYAVLPPNQAPMAEDSLFDLASLTKVILTTTEVLRLVQEGRVDLADPLALHLPDLRQYQPDHPVRQITIRQALSHRSGLPAVEPLYTWGSDPETLKALVLQKDWVLGADLYSDVNYVLLGILVERLRGKPLRDLLPPGDFAVSPGPSSRAVATERCTWRGRVMRGEVHDENAFALGGIAGHAGLFGSAAAVLDFAEAFLAGQVLRPATVAEARRSQGGPRGLGWEVRYDGWSGGSLCSPDTIGHTGFTGTALWIDLDRGHAWTLLTNRVHPSRHVETGIRTLRRSVSNAVAAAWPF